MSLYAMHENGIRMSQRHGNSKKTRRCAQTNSKIRRMVRRKDRRAEQRTKPDEE